MASKQELKHQGVKVQLNMGPVVLSSLSIPARDIYKLQNAEKGEEECSPSSTKFRGTMFGRSPFRDIYNVYFSYPRSRIRDQ